MNGKVLVVDDRVEMRDLIVECLAVGGYDACTAANGKEGLIQLFKHRPDLVVTDMRMPVMDGYEFSRLVRKACDTPIIMLAGLVEPDDNVAAVNLVDAYLAKPVSIDDLLVTVESVLKRTQRQAWPAETTAR